MEKYAIRRVERSGLGTSIAAADWLVGLIGRGVLVDFNTSVSRLRRYQGAVDHAGNGDSIDATKSPAG
jgi:hypothetical protein